MSITSTPILELPQGVHVISMLPDPLLNVVLLGLSDGRILKLDYIASNAFLTGERSLYAQIQNQFGLVSSSSWVNLLYRLHQKAVTLSSAGAIESIYESEMPFSANQTNESVGVFTTPVLWGGSDFSYWNELVYDQVVATGTRAYVGIRVGATSEEVLLADWVNYELTGSSIVQSLDFFNSFGSYMQIRVVLISSVADLTSSVSNLSVTYQTKYAVYCFTRKFLLDRNTDLKSALITATVTVPTYTEVKFGVTGSNSVDWRDYTIVELDKSFAVPAGVEDQIKVGIKFITESVSAAPVVDGFALMFGGDVMNQLNLIYQSSSSSSSSISSLNSLGFSSSSSSSVSSSSVSSSSSSSVSSSSSSSVSSSSVSSSSSLGISSSSSSSVSSSSSSSVSSSSSSSP